VTLETEVLTMPEAVGESTYSSVKPDPESKGEPVKDREAA